MQENLAGKFIVIDGADGSGKATQTELLQKRMEQENIKVETLDYPRYGKESAYFVEQYLNGHYGSAEEVSGKLASIFYALDRFDSKKEINDLLQAGNLVISNRYVSSNAGHQGGKISDKARRDEFLNWLYDLEYNICGLPKPDLNIYLHVPWEIGQKLVDQKKSREYINGKKRDIHEADSQHLKNAQETYLYLVEQENNWVKIDCIKDDQLMSREEIHEKIWGAIQAMI